MPRKPTTPIVREKEAQLISYYDNKLEYYSPASEAEMARIMLRVDAPTAGDMLDVGCGDGRASVYAVRHNMCYVGVDYSQQRITKAREEYGQTAPVKTRPSFMCTDIYEFLPNVSPKGYDLVWCCELLEHLEQPTVIWEAMKRVAKKMVVCTCPVNMPYHAHLQVFKTDKQIHNTFPGITSLTRMRFSTGRGKKREHFVFTYECE